MTVENNFTVGREYLHDRLQRALFIQPETACAAEQAEEKCREVFRRIEDIAAYNEAKVLKAFTDHRVSAAHLVGTTGYGYDDMGRDTLDAVFARQLVQKMHWSGIILFLGPIR